MLYIILERTQTCFEPHENSENRWECWVKKLENTKYTTVGIYQQTGLDFWRFNVLNIVVQYLRKYK